jgi:hypothetical protein
LRQGEARRGALGSYKDEPAAQWCQGRRRAEGGPTPTRQSAAPGGVEKAPTALRDEVHGHGKGEAFLEDLLGGWRRRLAALEDHELAPITYKSRWGEDYNIEQMLEHAIVHPMRHRIQLERLMEAASPSRR